MSRGGLNDHARRWASCKRLHSYRDHPAQTGSPGSLVPPNRRYYILDHIMVPINIRSTPEEVEALLAEAGAVDLQRFGRGCDFDRAEHIYRGDPFSREKFGVGENRYFFRKA
jgi:hypothetical protein